MAALGGGDGHGRLHTKRSGSSVAASQHVDVLSLSGLRHPEQSRNLQVAATSLVAADFGFAGRQEREIGPLTRRDGKRSSEKTLGRSSKQIGSLWFFLLVDVL